MANVFAASPVYSFDIMVDGIYYNLKCIDGEDMVAEVTNNGEWCATYSGNLVIPSSIVVDGVNYPVTGIGDDAFLSCNWLTSVSIPESVSYIGYNSQSVGAGVLSYCTNLESITVAENSQYYHVVDGVLYDSTKLFLLCVPAKYASNAFTVPNEVRYIEGGAFANCSNLSQVIIPSSVTSIGEYAFMCCSSLSLVNIPTSITTIPWGMFAGCNSITNINIPNNIQTIGNNAFAGSGLEEIVIPNSVTSIKSMAFCGCEKLESITLGNSIVDIEYEAFAYCPYLKTVTCEIPTAKSGDFFIDSPIDQATLYVPEASLESYKTTSPWSDFGTILPITATGIEDNTAAKSNTIDAIYDLDGKRSNGANRGMNIIRMTDGTTRKVMK